MDHKFWRFITSRINPQKMNILSVSDRGGRTRETSQGFWILCSATHDRGIPLLKERMSDVIGMIVLKKEKKKLRVQISVSFLFD